MLELKNIKKSYKIGNNIQHVLKGINLKFRDKEFTSILGISGSGKTTLLNIIGGLDLYDSGDLIIDGTSSKKYKTKDWDLYRNHRVGFIFQSYNLIMHQSVLNNVEISLRLSGISKKERKKKAIEALKKVGLKEHIHKKPNQLSGGQMQRVAIARALVNDPEIILADEPTGALDSKTSKEIMDILKEISKDKLVIMVTHNAEIANEYSTRIIELKDGMILNDNNPLTVGEKEVSKKRKIKKRSMSLLSALQLSFNNLLTKKGRTLLIGFAGSIGIIGIALILSLSNGVKKYAKQIEKESLTDYPLTFERISYDVLGSISEIMEESKAKQKCEKNKICSKDDIVKQSMISQDKGLIKRNNLKEFKKYIDENKEFKKYSKEIIYKYNIEIQAYTNDYIKVNPNNLSKVNSNIFNEIYLNDKNYKILKGNLPKEYNEIVLVVGNDYKINDSILYSLGIKDKNNLEKDLEEIKKNQEYKVNSTQHNYEELIDKTYKIILNTDYYKKEDDIYIDYSNDAEYMKNKIDNGIEVKIVGIVREKEATNSYIGYSPKLTTYLINEISKTNIYNEQINEKNKNVLTGEKFDSLNDTYDDLTEKLGIYELDNPSSINIYSNDYASKQKLEKLVEKYNDTKRANNENDLVVNYQDIMKNIINSITKIINIISYVLIGFVAISLVVSSIMILIITYISVLERTKEIGILRSIGASKKDIKRVFVAETIIEGLLSGILGVSVAYLMSNIINIIVKKHVDIDKISIISLNSAIILVLLSIFLNILAGRIPSKIASKKNPVESLRS